MNFAEAILAFIEQYGYWAIATLMLLENVFPPIPSELIMPFAGYAAARGDLHPAGVVAAGTVGSLAGAGVWYAIGAWVGVPRLRKWAARRGRWLTLSPADVDHAMRWFHDHGQWAVLGGRLVPAVRSLISVPAGTARMPLPAFLLWSTLGSLVWTTALMLAGFLLQSRFEAASHWLDLATKVVLGVALAGYLWRVARYRPQPG